LLFPYTALFLLLSRMGIEGSLAVAIYISIILFISQVSMFHLLSYLSNRMSISFKGKNLVLASGAVTYAASPFFLSLVPPGHINALVNYALFPFILLFFDRLLCEQSYTVKNLLLLFFLSTASATSYSNVGVIYSNSIVMASYTFFILLLNKDGLYKMLCKAFIGALVIFLGNIWWILPFFSILSPYADLNDATSLTRNVSVSSTNSSLTNIFSGEIVSAGQFNNYLFQANTVVYLILMASVVVLLIREKNKYISAFLCLLVLTIFISKGTNPPFAKVFEWLYFNLFGFKVFRRPSSKIYNIYTLSLVLLYVTSLLDLVKKNSNLRKFVVTIGISVALLSSFVFYMSSPVWSALNIPKYYYDAREYLSNENVVNLLVVPGPTAGSKYVFNESMGGYRGTDFLSDVWGYSILSPLKSGLGPDLPFRDKVNRVYLNILNGESICGTAKQLGINQVVVREDVTSNVSIDLLNKRLQNSSDVLKRASFRNSSGGLSVYTLNKECQNSLISLSNDPSVLIESISPLKYRINLKNLSSEQSLIFLKNFDEGWKLFVEGNSKGSKDKNEFIDTHLETSEHFLEGNDLSYLWTKSYSESTHSTAYDYANKWLINPKAIMEQYDNTHYSVNSDGSINANLVLYYKYQSLFFLGVIIWCCTLLILFLLFVNQNLVDKNKQNKLYAHDK